MQSKKSIKNKEEDEEEDEEEEDVIKQNESEVGKHFISFTHMSSMLEAGT